MAARTRKRFIEHRSADDVAAAALGARVTRHRPKLAPPLGSHLVRAVREAFQYPFTDEILHERFKFFPCHSEAPFRFHHWPPLFIWLPSVPSPPRCAPALDPIVPTVPFRHPSAPHRLTTRSVARAFPEHASGPTA